MSESQHVEWKESWRDEYLKWVCGFANAQGGLLEVGRNDQGQAVGVSNAARLMEELPNKMRDTLGIIADVDLFEEDGKQLVRITVEPYPYPVSYKGEYHYRTGSTKQTLKGAALDQFLLAKTGKRWDGIPLPGVAVEDLDESSLRRFRERAAKTKRLSAEDLEGNDSNLIERLRLKEGNYLKRAAVLLFHPDPEQFITGASIKIGYFESNSELLFQDEVQGSLLTQVDQTLDLLQTKYLKASISYDKDQRVEQYPLPESALRETLLNAIAHKDYSSGIPIQISVYPNKLVVWNNGQLPQDWTIERLTQKHPSQPFNPDIANAFFRAGMIEAWGRGIEKVFRACQEAEISPPTFSYEATGLTVDFEFEDQAGTKLGLSRDQAQILRKSLQSQPITELLEFAGRSNRTKFRDQAVKPLLESGLLEMTIPDKPKSPNQEYRTTAKGKVALDELDDKS